MQLKYLPVMVLVLSILSCNSGTPKRDMVTIMDSIRQQNHNKDNPFSSEAKLAFVDSMISNVADNSNKAAMKIFRAKVLLQTGDEKQACQIFDQMIQQFSAPSMEAYQSLLKNYAIASLRMGERQNCILGHSTASCIMPVSAPGIHHNKNGSANAIKAYTALLKINYTDLESRWLLNIAYMTLGEYPSGVPAQWLIPGLDKDTSAHPVKPFKDIAPALRLDTKNRAGGMIVDDFNDDGLMDIVSSDWDAGAPMHFFTNNGNGSFSDVSASSGIGKCNGGLNIVQADYNNDGFMDILVLRGGWMPGRFGKQPNTLLRNNGDNTFTDVTMECGLYSLHPTQTAVWRDFNNDGWLDLFIGNETTQPGDPQPCELFISDRHGGFKDMATIANCNVRDFVKGVASADYDNDGLMDVFISTANGKRLLLKNTGIQNGVPRFEDVTHIAGLDKEHASTFPTWFWDYDNDGWPDIFVCGYEPGEGRTMAYDIAADALHNPDYLASQMYLYHNNHDGTFTNVSVAAGLDHTVFAMGSNFGDIDNDGWLDMYLGTGNPEFGSLTPNKLFRNINGKKFEDVTVSAQLGNLQKGHGIAFSDIDNDGDEDIFLETGGAYDSDAYYNSLYLNPGQNNNHWLYIDLKGQACNRSAIGSRIKIKFTENGIQRTIWRDVNSGGSFGSSPLRREIGIGQSDTVDELTITWAGTHTTQVFKHIKSNQCIRITEGKQTIEKVPLKQLDMEATSNGAFPCAPVTRATVNK